MLLGETTCAEKPIGVQSPYIILDEQISYSTMSSDTERLVR